MLRVGFFATVGTGKDTMGRNLANRLVAHSPIPGKLCKVRHIQEFSVLWTDKTGGTTELFEQYFIFQKQREWDHDYDSRMSDPSAVIISSAPAPLAYFYTLAFADIANPKHRKLLKDLYEAALEEILQYDIVFYMPIEFEVPVGDRLRKPEVRLNIDSNISAFFLLHRIPFEVLRGPESARTENAFQVVQDMLKKKLQPQTT